MPSAQAVSAGALPAADCANPCSVNTLGFGFVAPAISIVSGTTVLWSTSAGGESHTATERAISQNPCFIVPISTYTPLQPVRFDIEGGSVVATETSVAPDGSTAVDVNTCTPVQTAPGVFVLPYLCAQHPYMRGIVTIHA